MSIGDRFYEVLFYFSSYVLRKVMMQEYTHGMYKIFSIINNYPSKLVYSYSVYYIIGNESAVPHMCKKITRMPNMNNICCKAMLIKMLAEKNRYVQYFVELSKD